MPKPPPITVNSWPATVDARGANAMIAMTCRSVSRPMRNSVLGARMTPGAHLVWLDSMMPMFRKTAFTQEAVIGIQRSTNHRFRCVVIFRRHQGVAP